MLVLWCADFGPELMWNLFYFDFDVIWMTSWGSPWISENKENRSQILVRKILHLAVLMCRDGTVGLVERAAIGGTDAMFDCVTVSKVRVAICKDCPVFL